MTFTDYKDKVFDSILISNLYNNDRERQMAVNNLKLFMDLFDYDGFYSTYDITEEEYNKYFKDTVQKSSKNWHQFAMQELERERKYNNENI